MAKHGKLRTYLEYAPVKLALMTLGYLPPRMAYGVGRSLTKLAYLLAADHALSRKLVCSSPGQLRMRLEGAIDPKQ